MLNRRQSPIGNSRPRELRAGPRSAAWYRPLTAYRHEDSMANRDLQATSRRTRLEAILWLSSKPITLRRLAKLAGLSGPTEARDLLQELGEIYTRRGSAFGVAAVGGGSQLMTHAKYAQWLPKGAKGRQKTNARGVGLSNPALETLTIVAHKQPVVRAEVEAIRGVSCGELLRQLLELDLLRIVGRGEELGRPLLYGTTGRFLQLFGLRSLEDLASIGEETTIMQPTTSNASIEQSRAA